MSHKERLMVAIGIIISLASGFQAYVVKDLHSELTYIRTQRDKQAAINAEKFSNIETNYITMKMHDRDMRRVEEGLIAINNKVYLWKRED